MRKAIGIAVLAGTLAVVPASGAQAASGSNYKGYSTCNVTELDKDKSCFSGDAWGAVFTAKRKDNVDYKLCVKGPEGKLCYEKTTKRAGDPSVIKTYKDYEAVGDYELKWKLPGKGTVVTKEFTLGPGD